jgi:hypothetical protein
MHIMTSYFGRESPALRVVRDLLSMIEGAEIYVQDVAQINLNTGRQPEHDKDIVRCASRAGRKRDALGNDGSFHLSSADRYR